MTHIQPYNKEGSNQMAVEKLERMKSGVDILSFSHSMTVGDPLVVSADVTEKLGRYTWNGTRRFEIGKINGITYNGVEVFKTEVSGKSRLMTKELVPWIDLDTGETIRRLITNSD